MREKFTELLLNIGIEITDVQYDKFLKYYTTLIEWNNKTNLTAITEFDDVFIKHFYDSLCLVKGIKVKSQSLLDVGSGAGFPSIPLKIIFEDIEVTIIDSLGKRIKFLEDLISELGIKATLIHGRVEDHQLRNHYDIVTARAVSNLQVLSELCIPFVKKNGYFVALKGPKYDEELDISKNAIKVLGGKNTQVVEYEIEDQRRALVIIEKGSETSDKYPRNFSQIKSKPL